jgi:hypothetical protein
MAKYDPLADFLRSVPGAQITVTRSFQQVASLVGGLPPSAYKHRAWWANDNKVEAQAWRSAGWHVDKDGLDFNAGTVRFARGKVGGKKLGANTPQIRVPSPETPWGQELIAFALSYNGYYRHGGTDGASFIAMRLMQAWQSRAMIEADVPDLRCALFIEQRAAHWNDQSPDPDYLAALLAAIHRQSGGWVDGPADPYP